MGDSFPSVCGHTVCPRLCWPLRFQGSPQTHQWECFLVFGNFSLFKTHFQGQISIPTSFASLFIFYILSYLLSKTMGCLSGCLTSSASIQKLFCGIYSAFKCSFDEFGGQKVVSPSYSSTILGSPQQSGSWWHQWILKPSLPCDQPLFRIFI